MSAAGGCGSGSCQCAGGAAAKAPPVPASINGIALHGTGEVPDESMLRERAWGELLRQEAVRRGALARHPGLEAPELSPADQQAIEAMLTLAIPERLPTVEECRRYHEARKSHFVQGQQARVRHILFAVTQGVDIGKLAARAEMVLLELSRKDAPPQRFGELAKELSNCPSGADGGDLGWLTPADCTDELANEFFHQPGGGIGLRPRLVHSRYGLHVVEILERKEGRPYAFEEVKERIAVQLAQQSRAKALHQFMKLLAGSALVEGVALEGADSPLVQ